VPDVPTASPGVTVAGGLVSRSPWSVPPHAMASAAHAAMANAHAGFRTEALSAKSGRVTVECMRPSSSTRDVQEEGHCSSAIL
jgi:hypothetical protein